VSQKVPSANVTVTFPNATLAASKLSDENGVARFTLLEKMMNATGAYPVGNYTINASYATHSDVTTLNLTTNAQLTLILEDFIIPELLSPLILAVLMATIPLVIIARRRQYSKHSYRYKKRACYLVLF
jgi:hypothetical protein